MTTKNTWLRFECGVEDRMSRDYGPFEYLQLVYNNLTTTDGEEVASYDPTTSRWSIIENYFSKSGMALEETDLKKWWSDIIIWSGEEKPPTCPSCGSSKIEEKIVANEFCYGTDWEAVTLVATEPQGQCLKCEFIWTDHRGEKAREAIINHHKSKKE